MNFKTALILSIAVGGLVSCGENRRYSTYTTYPGYEGYQYNDYQIYAGPEYRQYTNHNADNRYQSSQAVEVPESYHVGSYHSPRGHRNRDNSWIRGQNPQGYTIQLSEGRKASSVAKSLTRAPKRNRTATVKSFNGNAAYFRGVYGSYNNYEDAKRALNSLPADVRGGASIKRWSNVQN
jgi:septal ring-binding cell division protein DamX